MPEMQYTPKSCMLLQQQASVFRLPLQTGSWLKGSNGYEKMMSTLLICSVGAVIFMGGFMQQEKIYEDNLIRM